MLKIGRAEHHNHHVNPLCAPTRLTAVLPNAPELNLQEKELHECLVSMAMTQRAFSHCCNFVQYNDEFKGAFERSMCKLLPPGG